MSSELALDSRINPLSRPPPDADGVVPPPVNERDNNKLLLKQIASSITATPPLPPLAGVFVLVFALVTALKTAKFAFEVLRLLGKDTPEDEEELLVLRFSEGRLTPLNPNPTPNPPVDVTPTPLVIRVEPLPPPEDDRVSD